MKDNHDEVFDLFDDEGFDFEEDVVYIDDSDEEDFVEEEFDEGDEDYEEEYDEEYEEYEEEYEDDIDEEDDELFTRKRTKKSGSGNVGGSKKGLLIGLVALLAVVLIALAVMFLGKDGDDETGNAGDGQTTTAEETTTEEETTMAPVTLPVDTTPEMKTLMEQYYAAVSNADLAALGKVIDSTANISLQKMEKRAEYIENYSDIVCYTSEGLSEGAYFVLVSFNLKFVNIETPAPGMEYYYVKTNEEGALYVCTDWTDEEMNFINTQSQSEEVVNLGSIVAEKFADAMASDTKLNEFVQLLNGSGEVTTAAPEETTAAPEETTAAETPEETTPAAETPAETTAAQETPAESQAPETTAAQHTGDTAVVVSGPVRFRSSMDTSSSDNVIDELADGTKVNVIEIKGDWCLVSLADNADKSGYIHMDFLDFN